MTIELKHAIRAGSLRINGAGGDEIDAYLAIPESGPAHGGVVVIHHMPGFDLATKEIVRRFAVNGLAAIAPNLHWREAPGADPDDAAAASRAAGGVPDGRLVGDVGAARDVLLGLDASNGRTGVIGFCSGGRQTVLAACSLPFDAAVDCYGAFVLDPPPAESGMKMAPLTDLLPQLACPLLGLFGADDSHPSPEEVGRLDAILDDLGKPHDFHVFEGAGHAFFAVNRPAYRQAVAVEAWDLVDAFYAERLGGDAGQEA